MTDQADAGRGRRLAVRYGVRVLGLALFGWTLSRVDLGAVAASLAKVESYTVIVAIALCYAIIAAKTVRWLYLLNVRGIDDGAAVGLRVYADAIFWGTITPGRLGEFKRIAHIYKAHDIPLSRGAMLCLIDRGMDGFAALFAAALALGVAPSLVGPQFPRWPVIACLLGLAFLLVIRRPLIRVVRGAVSLWPKARGWALSTTADIEGLTHTQIIIVVLLSGLSFLFNAGMLWVLTLGLPFALTPEMILLSVGLTMIAGALPVSFFNLGPREAILLALFAGFGLTSEDAISFSALFLICYLIVMGTSLTASWLGRRLVAASEG